MARGKITPPMKREEAKMLYAIEENYSEVARKTGLPVQTIHQIVNGEDDEEYGKYRKLKKLSFIEQSWDKIDKFYGVVDQKYKELNAKDAVIAAATLYDKIALASGETGQNINIQGDKILVTTGVPRAENRPKE